MCLAPLSLVSARRPRFASGQEGAKTASAGSGNSGQHNGNGTPGNGDVLHKIEQMEEVVGKRMYRGLLKSTARVWNPKDIQDPAIQVKVLAHLQAAERGLRRAIAARERAGLAAFAAILGSLRLSSLDQVDNLKTLQAIVVALEATRSTK